MTNAAPPPAPRPRKRPPLRPGFRKPGPPLPPPRVSGRLLVRVAPSQVGMFRFLLEAYEHVAYFTVLNKYEALLKIVFSPHRERAARQALKEIGWSLPIAIREWPSATQNRLTSSALCTTQES